MRIRKRKRQWQSAHSATVLTTAGYPACSSELQGPDGESARIGMASPLITFISPSDTAGPSALNSYVYVYVYVVPNLNATVMRPRLRTCSQLQNGSEYRQL